MRVSPRNSARVALVLVDRIHVTLMPTASNDLQIVEEFTRVCRSADSLVIEVAQIDWEGSHTPIRSWTSAVTLAAAATPAAIQDARFALLASRRYFRICRRCRERQPLGWMHDGAVCQSCAEKYYGVIH